MRGTFRNRNMTLIHLDKLSSYWVVQWYHCLTAINGPGFDSTGQQGLFCSRCAYVISSAVQTLVKGVIVINSCLFLGVRPETD